jgi:hypothetical protein
MKIERTKKLQEVTTHDLYQSDALLISSYDEDGNETITVIYFEHIFRNKRNRLCARVEVSTKPKETR